MVLISGAGKTTVVFLSTRYYIFLIAIYRRTSGSDLTATSPTAIPAAAMVSAVTYPSVRITFSCSSAGLETSARDIDVPNPGAGSALPGRPGLLPACSAPGPARSGGHVHRRRRAPGSGPARPH